MHCIISNWQLPVCGNLHSCTYRLVYLLAEVKKCDPFPAINYLFSLRDRHTRQNEKAKNQEWFVGVFDVGGLLPPPSDYGV